MSQRIYNFGAGPAMLPESVLQEVQAELLDWQGLGVSILEIGHRTEAYCALMAQAELDLRELLGIPSQYHVLFLGSPARAQFSVLPLNLLGKNEQAGYLISGVWSEMAYNEACRLVPAYCVASTQPTGFTHFPAVELEQLNENTAYVYYTPNETVNGVRCSSVPAVNGLPLVADMTSCLLTEPIDVSQYGVIFAGAQKNIANAGLTVVIVHHDWLDKVPVQPLPAWMDYRTQVAHQGKYATPPVFNCYLAAKMFQWVKAQGGVSTLHQLNCQKAHALYQYLDQSDFYTTRVEPQARSLVNVCFALSDSTLETAFLDYTSQRGLYALKGHRSVGGMRASLYNAMPQQGVDALIQCMNEFAKAFG